MLKRERQSYILHQANLHNKVLSSTLCQEVNVSNDTMRRDLQEPADAGRITKKHSGARSLSFNNFSYTLNKVYSFDSKRKIAQKAISLIENGMFILTSGGSTITESARALPSQLHVRFISGSIPAIHEYMYHPEIDVILVGDKISGSAKIMVGGESVEQIKRIKADMCFLGINAPDPEHGITGNEREEVQVKKGPDRMIYQGSLSHDFRKN